MNEEYRPRQNLKAHPRWLNVLEVLKEHGPLPVQTISELSNPKLKKRDVHEVASRLCELKLLYKRVCNPSTFPACYQILQPLWARRKTSRLMNCHPDDLLQPQHRHIWVYHNIGLVHWYLTLKKLSPKFEVYRRHDPVMRNWLEANYSQVKRDRVFLPNLLIISKTSRGESIVVPVKFSNVLQKSEYIDTLLWRTIKNQNISGQLFIGTDWNREHLWDQVREMKNLRLLVRSRTHPKTFFAHYLEENLPPPHPLQVSFINSTTSTLLDWLTHLPQVARV